MQKLPPLSMSGRCLRVASLTGTGLCLGLVLGCHASPSATIDTAGLGDSAVAVVIKQNWMINPEKSIEAGVQALIERAGPAGRTAKGLASMGFQCVSPQIPQCVYSGHLIRTLSGLPKDTKADPTVRLDIRVETAPDGNAIRVVVTSKETPIGV